MNFDPQIGQTIQIAGKNFQFMAHPSAPKFIYSQTGRRGTVYQLRAEDGHYFAFKVFKPFWQDLRIALTAPHLAKLAVEPKLEGLQACQRYVITEEQEPGLFQNFSELRYAVLMPWIAGDTWFEIFHTQRLNTGQSLQITQTLARLLSKLEMYGAAHCDLSGPNVMIDLEKMQVVLVDVEEMFARGMPLPEKGKVQAGTEGYAHKGSRKKGLWSAEADRFAGAVLMAEILGASDERIFLSNDEDTYFVDNQMQKNCERYKTLYGVLCERWGQSVGDLFKRAWFSRSLAKCPSFYDWVQALNALSDAQEDAADDLRDKFTQAEALHKQKMFHQEVILLESLYNLQPDRARDRLALALIERAKDEQSFGDIAGAREDCREALALGPSAPVREQAKQLNRSLYGLTIELEKQWNQARAISIPWKKIGIGLLFILLLLGAGLGAVTGYQWMQAARIGTVHGTVVDARTHSALAGAAIRLSQGSFHAEAQTDTSGRFAFTQVPRGEITLTTEREGYTSQSVKVALDSQDSGPVEIAMDLMVARVYGEVFDMLNGAGLENATVRVVGTYATGEAFDVSGVTDSQGKYQLYLPGSGSGSITFSHAGYADYPAQTFSFQTGENILIPTRQLEKIQ